MTDITPCGQPKPSMGDQVLEALYAATPILREGLSQVSELARLEAEAIRAGRPEALRESIYDVFSVLAEILRPPAGPPR